MIAVAEDARAVSTVDVALLAGSGLLVAETAAVQGLAHAVRLTGLSVHTSSSASAGGTHPRIAILFATLASIDDDLAALRGELPENTKPIVFPLVRNDAEIPRWSTLFDDLADQLQAIWVAVPELASTFESAPVAAVNVGMSCELGGVHYHSRQALGIRDEDYVFLFRAPVEFGDPAAVLFRQAWSTRRESLATRYAKASVVIEVSLAAASDEWRAWTNEADPDSLLVLHAPDDALQQLSLADCCDCEIVCTPETWFSFWAVSALCRGRHVLALGDEALPGLPRALGKNLEPASVEPAHVQLAHLQAVTQVADLQSWLCRLPERRATDREAARLGARQLLSEFSARATAVRIVEALRFAGLWNDLVWKIESSGD